MYSVSEGFISTLRSSTMRVVTHVTAGDVTLDVVSGSVSMDATRDIGRTCTLELAPTIDRDLEALYSLVSAPGVELAVWRGLMVGGEPELVPLGVFSTDTVSVAKGAGGTVSWSGSDRSKKIARNRFIDPYVITAGTSLAAAGTALLQSRLPGVEVSFGNVTDTVAVNVAFEAGPSSDPWKVARQLFEDYGYDLRFSGLGAASAVIVSDPTQENAVFDFGTGQTNIVLDGTAETTLESVYNGVIAAGEGTEITEPVRAVVWDDDPSSPTYYLGGYGQVPYFFSSPLITTTDQATRAASALLSRVKGRSQLLSWPSIVNPALEPLDVVTVTFNGVTSALVLDALTVPLSADASMTAKARAVTL